MAHVDIAMHVIDIGCAPAHASEFGLFDGLHIFLAADDAWGEDDEEFGPFADEGIVAKEVLDDGDIAEPGDFAMLLPGGFGDETAEDDGFAVGGADGGLGGGGIDPGGADDGAAVGDGDGDPFGFGAEAGFLRVDFHDHIPFGADAWGDADDETDIFETDGILDEVDIHRGVHDAGDTLTDLDEGGLVIEGEDLGSAEDFEAS